MQALASHLRHFGLSGDGVGDFQAVSTALPHEGLCACSKHSAVTSPLHTMQCCAALGNGTAQAAARHNQHQLYFICCL